MTKEQPSPRIQIGRKIVNGELPYAVDIDETRVVEFLHSRGVPDQKLSNLKLRVRNKDFDEAAKTTYDDKKDVTISVSAGYAWGQYEEAIYEADEIADGNILDSDHLDDLLYTRRLTKYLQFAPKARGLKVAKKLLLNAVSREVNGVLLHELNHFADLQTGKHRFWYSTAGVWISDLLDFARYKIDVSEREAVEVEERNRNDPAWRSILKIVPTNSNP